MNHNDSWKYPIYIEIGSSVLKKYTAKKSFLGPAPENAGLLLQGITELRQSLSERGVYLPAIHVTDSEELDSSSYKIHFSNIYLEEAESQKDLLSAISEVAIDINLTAELIDSPEAALQDAYDALLANNYEQAMQRFRQCHILSLLYTSFAKDLFIQSVYNIGYIHFINNQIQSAAFCGHLLLNVIETENYYDPMGRYQVHMFCGEIITLLGDIPTAIDLYEKAYHDLDNCRNLYDSNPMAALALWDLICAYHVIGRETSAACLNCIQNLFDLVYSDERSTKDILAKLHYIHAACSDKKIAELEEEKNWLEGKCREYAAKLKPLHIIGATVTQMNGLLIVLSSMLPKTVTKNVSVFSEAGKIIMSFQSNTIEKVSAVEHHT